MNDKTVFFKHIVDRQIAILRRNCKIINCLASELKQTGLYLDLENAHPVIINNAGNLIVHLSPYSIVARIIKLSSEDNTEFWKNVLVRVLM